MKPRMHTMSPLAAISLALCLGFAARADDPPQTQNEVKKQQKECEQKVRPEVEQQRKEAEQTAEKNLDQDAIAAIEATGKAIQAIADGKTDEALSEIEQATGKIDVLMARNPATALVPVSVTVEIIDSAPSDISAIRARAGDAEIAMDNRDYPAARVLLESLTSEIRVRTSNLPLATYPDALKEAARLLDQKKPKEADTVVLTALNALVTIDQVTPLPVAVARTDIGQAQALREKDKKKAEELLTLAQNQLERARELGYAGEDPEYASLSKSISELEEQVESHGDTTSAFAELKEKVAAFFTRLSKTRNRA
ncbi:MAG TPA: YfdX family protein [Verrucomicrobiae bacterium]|nr:YfdX family protein [Verrucomicrobiae bacterium]